MFTSDDKIQIESKGIRLQHIENQIKMFQKGFPYIHLSAPATIGDGIIPMSESRQMEYAMQYNRLIAGRKIIKFVPASGAASRMFRHLYELVENAPEITDLDHHLFDDKSFNSAWYFFENIKQLALFEDLEDVCKSHGTSIEAMTRSGRYKKLTEYLLESHGLGYSSLPKALLKFHRYINEPHRTALEEHLVEAAHYATDTSGVSTVHFTVSPEHRPKFDALVEKVINIYEKRFGVRYKIGFSEQQASTDLLAVDLNNKPFREKDGQLHFRPGGHGALIENLNDLKGDIVFIKNIDNITPDRLREPTLLYKKLLGALLIEFQSQIFSLIDELLNFNISKARIREIAVYCSENLNISLPVDFAGIEASDAKDHLLKMLNRPIRICGMVRNEGEPGGGPYWIKDKQGLISLQIVESSQIDINNTQQKEIFDQSTHFNPVDIVCGVCDYQGNPFHLPAFVDHNTGFISIKSKDGLSLKALELPGLWNGAMAHWNTFFVEVPIITFNPVKTINDLLRKEHLAI